MPTPPGVAGDIRRYMTAKPAAAKPAAAKPSSPVGSVEGEDPLFGDAMPRRLPDLRPEQPPPPSRGSSWVGSRIAVVLKASPSRDARREARFAKRPGGVKETPVPLPWIPGWSGTPPARPKTQPAPGAASNQGRPKGWKPGMSYAAMRGNAPPGARARQARAKAPAPGFGKRRRRPPKPPSPPPRDIYRGLEAQFVAFLCEWTGCRAELHNLDTLRRHVYAVHGREAGRRCRWRRCADAQPAAVFGDDDAAFRRHVEEAHLVPLAWHVGDGPQNGGCRRRARRGGGDDEDGEDGDDEDDDDDGVADFLKDAQGRQVTPSVRDQEVEDFKTWQAKRRKLKELFLRRDEMLPDDESDSAADEA